MNNYINQTPNMPMYNGYNNYRLPTYEVIKVNGRGGANAFQMGPNSSILLLDETDNVVWLAQTDGAGYKTVTPFSLLEMVYHFLRHSQLVLLFRLRRMFRLKVITVIVIAGHLLLQYSYII